MKILNIILTLSIISFFGAEIFAGRFRNPTIYSYPITVYSPHTPDTIPMFLTLDGVAVHCFFEDR